MTRGGAGAMLALMCADAKDHGSRAARVLMRLQKALVERLAEYVVENETSLRRAAEGVEGYGYAVHQIDELFLTRLNLIERALAEIQRGPNGAANRYRSLCFRASGRTVEQEINSRLEKLPEARVLGVSVSQAGHVGTSHDEAGRAGPGGSRRVADAAAAPAERGTRSAECGTDPPSEFRVPPSVQAGGGQDARPSGRDLSGAGGGATYAPPEEEADQVIVTVLYYGREREPGDG